MKYLVIGFDDNYVGKAMFDRLCETTSHEDMVVGASTHITTKEIDEFLYQQLPNIIFYAESSIANADMLKIVKEYCYILGAELKLI